RSRIGCRRVRSRHRHAHQKHSPQARTRSAPSALCRHDLRNRLQIRGRVMWHRRRIAPPPWWPPNEPWPPRYRRSPYFVRTLRCPFTTLIFLTAIGLLLSRTQQLAIAIAVGIAIIVALTSGFTFTLRRESHRLRAEDQLRRQLMADVAHELRTPLAILQG